MKNFKLTYISIASFSPSISYDEIGALADRPERAHASFKYKVCTHPRRHSKRLFEYVIIPYDVIAVNFEIVSLKKWNSTSIF